MTGRRLRLAAVAVAAAAAGVVAPASAGAVDHEPVLAPLRASLADVAGVDPGLSDVDPGGSGQHIVCYAPGFSEYTICVDYPG